MGCVASRIHREERVRICKERKMLMKQLMVYRKEFADSLLDYLRGLKNTGATLRQFTEPDLLEIEEFVSNFRPPPSPPLLPPPPPLPPSPTPSNSSKNKNEHLKTQSAMEEEMVEMDEDCSHTPPPPPPDSSWHYWNPFCASSIQCDVPSETSEDEDNWAETSSQFAEDDGEEAATSANRVNLLPRKQQLVGSAGDNPSTTSQQANDSMDMSLVIPSKKSLSSIVEDLDEYFLKASAVLKNVAVIIDINTRDTFLYTSSTESKRTRSNSTKVFRALTWNWSLKSLQSFKETEGLSEIGEPCKPGAHCITLKKLYSEERKLHKDVKEEVIAKVEYGRKSLLLQRLEEEHDWTKAEKTRLAVESLEAYILSLQESIRQSYSTILKLIKDELHPQIFALASGLMHMWRTMSKCHQIQSQIAQQMIRATNKQQRESTSEYHLQAAAQLQREVACWYHSFCRLVKFQREYVSTLCKWIELTSFLGNIDTSQGHNSTSAHTLLGEWLRELDKLPDKMVSEAIKSLLFAVEAMMMQQQEECSMHKQSDKLKRKLERELGSLSDLELKFGSSLPPNDTNPTSKHSLSIRRTKVAALQKLVDNEKAKCVHSIKSTNAIILNNFQTSLPSLFRSLAEYTKACVLSFEGLLGSAASDQEDFQLT